MDDRNYETAGKLLDGATVLLEAAHDEFVEFGVSGIERNMILHIKTQLDLVRKLSMRVKNHQRVIRFAAQG